MFLNLYTGYKLDTALILKFNSSFLKSLNGAAPKYITDMLVQYNPVRPLITGKWSATGP